MKGRLRHPELLTKFWADESFEVGVQLPSESVFPSYDRRKGIIFVDEKGNFIYDGGSKNVQSYLSKFSVWASKQAQPSKEGKEKEKKGTSDVVPASSMTSNDVHGGDGASGEVTSSPNKGGKDHEDIANSSQEHNPSDYSNVSSGGSKTDGNIGPSTALESNKGGDDSLNKDSGASSSGQGSGSSVPDQTMDTDASVRNPAAGVMNTEERDHQLSAEEENTLTYLCRSGSQTSESNESNPELSRDVSDGGADEKNAPVLSEKERSVLFKGVMKGFGKLNPSYKPNPSFGGQYGSLKDVKTDKQLILQARRVFSKMIHGGEGEAGPRYSVMKFSKKMAGYLREPSVDDRRLEDGRPALLVMADTSGSMGNFSNEVLSLGMAVKNMGGVGRDIILINESNGYPLEVMTGNKIDSWDYYDQESNGNEKIIEWYLKLIRQHNIKAVVVAADGDGAWLYEALSKVVDIYWVDVYCCNYGDVRIRNISEIEGFSGFNKKKVHYADRCSTAKEMLSALSIIVMS